MSVQSQIDRIEQNVANTYAVLAGLGTDMPSEQNSDNLARTAGTTKAVLYSQQNLTEAQKAQARANIGAVSKDDLPDVVYVTVDSVEEMTDTKKSYILSTTGTIWTYGETVIEKVPENVFVKSTAKINARIGADGNDTSTTNGSKGCFCTDYIELTDWASLSSYVVRMNFELKSTTTDANGVYFYNESKAYLNGPGIIKAQSSAIAVGNGVSSIDIKQWSGYSTAKYVRLRFYVKESGTAITTSDLENVEITFDAHAGTIIESGWYDTGMTPAESDGGNYTDLLVKVNNNKSDIAELDNRVIALETGSDSIVIPSFWQTAVDMCISKIKALQVGRNCITFPFFSDNHQRNGYAGVLIAKVMQECHIPFCFYGGDSISNGTIANEAEMIAQDKAFDTIMSYVPNGRFCRAVGNHDGYWYDGTNRYYYTREQVYELFLREEAIAQNKHFGDDGTYYYVDDIASKVRFIVLNTNEVDSAQLAWLANTALKFSENGWAVVFISHHPIANYYHTNITNAAEVVSAVNEAGVDIIGWFSGHIHRDRMTTYLMTGGNETTAGTPSTTLGFTQVTITSDNTSIAYKNDDGTESPTKHTTANDDQSHAIDFVTINRDTRTVNLTRLGIGNDRSYSY